jgi:subtilisin family serine protease
VAVTPSHGATADGSVLTNNTQLTVTGNVGATAVNVRVYDFTVGGEIGFGLVHGNTFSLPVTLATVGKHVLWVNAVDTAGNDSATTEVDVFVDENAPTVDQINGAPVAPTTSPVDALSVVFSKPIDVSTFDYHALELTRNGGPNLIGSGVTISQVNDTTFAISGLAALTSAPGTYKLTVNATDVQDLAGNAGTGSSTVSWTEIVPDTTPPTSSATAPATVHAFNFTVSWSGQDNPGGSGVAYFDIYSNVDGGPFSIWQFHTTANSATFAGTDQHSYGFFSIATDVAGNQEPMKTAADATAFVSIRGEIHGRVFNDINRSGTDAAGSQNGLQGWTVFLDLQNDGRLDPGDPSTTTAADGSFAFTGLTPGTYTVGEVVQPGWQLTYPASSGSSVREAQVTVGAADAPVYLADTTAPAGATSTTAANQALIGLDQFRNDPRFAGISGQGETVVVLDSGVDVTNPYFGPVSGNGLAAGIVYQHDFVDNTASALDVLGHGTLVASIIGSRDATNPGVAPGVQIIDLKVLDNKGSGDFSTGAQALQCVATNAARYNIVAVNMSFGDGGDYSQPQSLYGLGSVLAELSQENIITVSAAGNNFYGDQSVPGVAYPAADPNVLPVGAVWASSMGGPFSWSNGAVDCTTAADQIMSFSQRDAQLGEVFAPGAFIQGARPAGGVATLSGTSMATADITGVAALADQLAVQTLGRALTPAEFRYLLAATSATITDDGSDNVRNTGLAYNRVDVEALATAILDLNTTPIPPELLVTAPPTSGGAAHATSVPSGEQSVNVNAGAVVTGVDFGNFIPVGPDNLTYGTALAGSQLGSSLGGIPGSFAFTGPDNGKVLHVSGSPYTEAYLFTPTDTTHYSTVAGTVTVTVAPVPLTVTAINKTMPYGGPLPTLTTSYSGFVNSDTSASLTTPPPLTTTATAASHVSGNPYSITASGAVDTDYTISYAAGNLTVLPVALTITADSKTMPYGGLLPTLTAGYSGFVNGDTSASLTTLPTLTTTATAASHVSGKPYSITASGAVDSDYSISYVAGTLTVTPVALTITADSKTMVYGQTLPGLTASYSGLVNSDTAASLTTAPTLTTVPATSHVGTYSITAAGAVDPDYTIGYAAGTLSITPATLTVTADNESRVYGQANPTLTASYGGFVNGDTAAVVSGAPSLSTSASTTSPTGTYAISAGPGSLAAQDYAFQVVNGTLTVTQASTGSTLTASAATPLFGVDTVTFTATVAVVAPGSGSPSGSIDFVDTTTGADLGSVALSGGTAALSTGTLALGSHAITAIYSCDGNFLSSRTATALTVIPPASLSGTVFADFNDDGEVDFGETGIAGVSLSLTGTDDLGHAVSLSQKTDGSGAYLFAALRPGSYYLTKTSQPAGYTQGIDSVGIAGGSLVGTDEFFLQLAQGVNGLNYNFGEQPVGTGPVHSGQTAGVEFWKNRKGQALIKALNGGPSSTELGSWLAATLPNLFGKNAGAHNLAGKSNADIAAFVQSEASQRGEDLTARVLATALSVYATNSTLDPTSAAAQYGFTVSGYGVGTASVNVGGNGDAFGVANNTSVTVMDLLLGTDAQTVNGVSYAGKTERRQYASAVYADVIEDGNIN